MKYLDVTLSTPEQNLACDEALLEASETGGTQEMLRFWQPRQYFVVVGYANRVSANVNVAACSALGIPILRRCSGGGTVLQGPGCLNYTLILALQSQPQLASISSTNAYVMQRHAGVLTKLLRAPVLTQGTTDLTLGARKFSGNAQRRKRHCLVFHGTFLLQFDLALLDDVLTMPEEQPVYRENRPHHEFLTNLELDATDLKNALKRQWGAFDQDYEMPYPMIEELVATRYSKREWNFKF